MKILISENQLNELKGQFKDEIEIIYKDKNLLCIIPKSQMTSHIYGNKAEWCQRGPAFDSWSDMGLLIRFLFKQGRKIRLTYLFKQEQTIAGGHFHWANETGYHVLTGINNPFEVKSYRHKKSNIEEDILKLIQSIPQNCKETVLKFIEQHKEQYDYCKSDHKYEPESIKNAKEKFREIVKKHIVTLEKISVRYPHVQTELEMDNQNRIYKFRSSETFGIKNNYKMNIEEFKNIISLENRIKEFIRKYPLN